MSNPAAAPIRLRYADVVRQKMKTSDNRLGRPLMIRELARHIGASYEHIRKIVNGDPVVSREFSDALCSALGLDVEKMWELARYEKLMKKFKQVPLSVAMPPDMRFTDLWNRLTDEQKLKLFRIAEVYAMENDAETFLAKKEASEWVERETHQADELIGVTSTPHRKASR